LDTLAQAAAAAAQTRGIEVVCLYRNMFLEMMGRRPELLGSVDLVHFIHGVESYPLEMLRTVKSYCPIVSMYHHREYFDLRRQFELVDHLFYVSEVLRADVVSLPLNGAGVSLLHSGVDKKLFSPAGAPPDSREFTVGFFGTQTPDDISDRKGTALLLAAAGRLAARGYRPSFLIAGYGWGRLVSSLRKLGLKVTYRVNVSPHAVPHLYRGLDLYLITSRLEGGPLTLLEAAASGVPVISTPVGLALEILNRPGCGRVLDGFHEEEIAEAVVHDIRHRDEARRRAALTMNEVRERWTWGETYAELPAVYARVAQSSGRRATPRGAGPEVPPYMDIGQDWRRQLEVARRYAMVDFAWRLYWHGDRAAALRTALGLLGKVPFSHWRLAFLRNVLGNPSGRL
jgi:glycosyltransferase involved in cell wall biosynthesis